jgi:N-methylhydantoinase A
MIREYEALADVHVSLSSNLLPEYREYERTATTVINAYVAPLMNRYLARLAGGLGKRRLTVMQSNGGVISAGIAGRQAARTVLSGPAGGVVGARYVAGLAGFDELITFDMGGTSTDVALCPGRLPTTSRGEIAGLPLRLPVIDIHTVGAGGGSLAYVDAGGALHVGPQSAGADPGPACYGKTAADWKLFMQGQDVPFRATTTDANLVLGRLDAGNFLGGDMMLDTGEAQQALTMLATSMGVPSLEEAAAGVIRVANATMERAMRRISVERGYDPRRFILVAFGGAGPLHACDLALNMGIQRVLIPTIPGVLSALGMLAAAPTKDYSHTVMRPVGNDEGELAEWLDQQFLPLANRAVREMTAEGHSPESIEQIHSVDVRYVGQAHELTIPFQRAGLGGAFHAAHENRYGYSRLEAPIEIVTLRLSAVAPLAPLQLPASAPGLEDAHGALIGKKQVWFDGQMMVTSLYERGKLRAGHQFSGPAVVFQYDTTTVIPPVWEAAVDIFGNLVLARS